VDVSSLSYTSSADRLPRSGSAGDLWLTGDAITSSPGQPGNYMFSVAGSEIATLELQFSSNVGVGPTDPFFAMSVLCFEPEQADPELDPPTASLDLVEPKPAPLIGGKYRVHYACSETAPNLVSATINGYDMNDGQQIRLIVDDNELVRYGTGPWANEVLLIQAPEFSFDVTCADDSGNQVSTSVIPEFVMP
ncbi:MAG: hypothetical protein R3D55_20830, partial [Chloroflexota bacterium]